MNKNEARRYAHAMVVDAIAATLADSYPGPDGPKIVAAWKALREQHARFGPKTTDRPPREPIVPLGSPLFDAMMDDEPAPPAVVKAIDSADDVFGALVEDRLTLAE